MLLNHLWYIIYFEETKVYALITWVFYIVVKMQGFRVITTCTNSLAPALTRWAWTNYITSLCFSSSCIKKGDDNMYIIRLL